MAIKNDKVGDHLWLYVINKMKRQTLTAVINKDLLFFRSWRHDESIIQSIRSKKLQVKTVVISIFSLFNN